MAYSFSASTDKITFAAPTFSTSDMSIALWFRTSSSVQYAQLIGNEVATGGGTGANGFTLLVNHNTATDGLLYFYVSSGAGATAVFSTSGTDWSDGAWHAVAVTRSGNSYTLWVDGTSRATGTDAQDLDGAADIVIGRNDAFTPRNLAGDVAEIGIWTGAALNAAEVNALYRGFSCDQVRPQNLVRYLPLVRATNELARGTTVNVTGGAVATHPRIIT